MNIKNNNFIKSLCVSGMIVIPIVAVTSFNVIYADGENIPNDYHGRPANMSEYEVDYDRPGSDIDSFDVVSPEVCSARCAANPRCVAFTYTRPGYQGAMSKCWLKNAIPEKVENSQCVSGYKYATAVSGNNTATGSPNTESGFGNTGNTTTATGTRNYNSSSIQTVMSEFEYETDRTGADYTSFRIEAAENCRVACAHDRRCMAYSFTQPGYRGATTTMCYLKTPAPPASRNPLAISGVKLSATVLSTPSMTSVETALDRPGSDYRTIDPISTVEACSAACAADRDCKAYTFVTPSPGELLRNKCWLKNALPNPVQNPYTSSGVKY